MAAMATRPAAPPASVGEVLDLIRSGRATTRSEIGRVTGLSRTAVAARLLALLRSGLVVEGEEGPSSGGRPPSRLRFHSTAGVVLAAAVGRSRTQLAICDLAGTVLSAADIDQEPGLAPDDLLPRVADRFGSLLDGTGRLPGEVKAVGLSIPGTVDFERGASLDSPIMRGWDGVPLAPYFADFGDGPPAPVYVDNDAHVMGMSERNGHLRSYRDLLMVKASTGLGAGVFSRGRLVRGALGAAGEIGHTKSAAAAGRECRCGDTGCLEAVAGGWALVQELRAEGYDVGHIRDVVALAAQGDPRARHLVRESGRRLGEVLASAVNLLNPEAVVIGGDMVQAYDTFAAGVRESIYGNATALATRELQIVPATHRQQSGVVGCAALALEHLLSPRAVDLALS
jgi:predicted NBD/HSP70 family sugar kinase